MGLLSSRLGLHRIYLGFDNRHSLAFLHFRRHQHLSDAGNMGDLNKEQLAKSVHAWPRIVSGLATRVDSISNR